MRQVKELRPTIWRTVRAMLNERRLRFMRLVFLDGGRLCVRELAKLTGVDDSIASIYLRQLNARGLLGCRRGNIKVFYNLDQDRSLPDSVELQTVMREVLSGRLSKGWESEIMTILKAFSFQNRLAIVVRLAEGPATLPELGEAVGCCVKSLYHQLRFLYSADLIEQDPRASGETVVRLRTPNHPLARVLLKLTLGNQRKFARYFNPPPAVKTDAASLAVLRKLDRIEGNDGADCWKRKIVQKTKGGRLPDGVAKALSEVG